MTIPKRHHYLPRFYLERFASRDGHFWLYDRSLGSYRRVSSRNAAVRRYYYSTEDEEGQRFHDFEDFLSRIEGLAKPIFDKPTLWKMH